MRNEDDAKRKNNHRTLLSTVIRGNCGTPIPPFRSAIRARLFGEFRVASKRPPLSPLTASTVAFERQKRKTLAHARTRSNQTPARTHTSTHGSTFFAFCLSLWFWYIIIIIIGNRSPALVYPCFSMRFHRLRRQTSLSRRNVCYLSVTAVQSPQTLLMSCTEVWRIFIAVAGLVTTAAVAATGISSISTARRYQRSKQVIL